MNVRNRTLFTGDNLNVLRGINSASVDLVYLDPPFNSRRQYSAPVGSEAAGAAFHDTWHWDDLDAAWLGELADQVPKVAAAIEAAGLCHGQGMKSYLLMMGVRLIEMKRVLKPHGSIYLHCDPTANSYLRMLMDSIFGAGNFQNELAWKRSGGKSDANKYGPCSDRLLYYAPRGARWNRPYLPYEDDYVRRVYRLNDGDGRGDYMTAPMHGPGLPGEPAGPWRGYDPADKGNHWRLPTKGATNSYIIENRLISGWPNVHRTVHEGLELLDEADMIHWSKNGVPRLKVYLAAARGRAATDFIEDIPMASGREKVGYPTQKPLALLRRVIEASSNQGDVVMDPFCGCATTCVAAELLGRRWIGIDLSELAAKLVVQRLRDTGADHFGNIVHRTDIPMRTDRETPKPYRTRKHELYGQQEGHCAGCRIHFPFRNLTVDHIVPRVKGGTDHLDNLNLLCGACNSMKGTRSMAYLLARLAEQETQ